MKHLEKIIVFFKFKFNLSNILIFFLFFFILQLEDEITNNPLSKPEGDVAQTSAEALYATMLPSLPQVSNSPNWKFKSV